MKRSLAHRSRERGSVLPVLVLIAALIFFASRGVMQVGLTGQQISLEKQLIDTNAMLIGSAMIYEGLFEACGLDGRPGGSVSEGAEELYQQVGQRVEDRELRCEPLDEGLIERGPNDPSGPEGTFRRYKVSSTLDPESYGGQGEGTEREVVVEVREIYAEIERPRPQIAFALDYSGSMLSGGRIEQLKGAFSTFVGLGYEMDYSLNLYRETLYREQGLSSGVAHDQAAVNLVNSVNPEPGWGTAFAPPLSNALLQLTNAISPELYIILVTDGFPQDGPTAQGIVDNQIRNVPDIACYQKNLNTPCVTIYSLGVDNADTNMLINLSGNAVTPPDERVNYTYAANATDTAEAFRDILEDILCRYGPFDPPVSPDEVDTINVFLNEERVEPGVDFSFDPDAQGLKFYNDVCQGIIDGQDAVTIRYGIPRLIIPERP